MELTLQDQLKEKFADSPLDIGRLAKIFMWDEYLVDEINDRISWYSDELCVEMIQEIEEAEYNRLKSMPIDTLPLSMRTMNALIKNDIIYVEDLKKKSEWELLLMRWIGTRSIYEINKSLSLLEKTSNQH